MIVALVVIAVVGISAVAGTAVLGAFLARRAADETREQMHAALVDERTGWFEQHRAWQEERKMLLDRLSDREGRQVSVFQPAPVATPEPKRSPVAWDRDLEPFDFEKVVKEEEGGEGGPG